jgi:hypothetical protein
MTPKTITPNSIYAACRCCHWNGRVACVPTRRMRCPACNSVGCLEQLYPEAGYFSERSPGFIRQKCRRCQRVCWQMGIAECKLGHPGVNMVFFPSGCSGYRREETLREYFFKCPTRNCSLLYGGEKLETLAGQRCPVHPSQRLHLAGSRIMLASGLGRGR